MHFNSYHAVCLHMTPNAHWLAKVFPTFRNMQGLRSQVGNMILMRSMLRLGLGSGRTPAGRFAKAAVLALSPVTGDAAEASGAMSFLML